MADIRLTDIEQRQALAAAFPRMDYLAVWDGWDRLTANGYAITQVPTPAPDTGDDGECRTCAKGPEDCRCPAPDMGGTDPIRRSDPDAPECPGCRRYTDDCRCNPAPTP